MRRPNAGGFIFMEVILTLAILTVGAVATFQSYRLSMRAFHESHERFEAGLLLERQLGEYEKTRLLNRTLATDSFLNPVTWNDEVVRTDPLYGAEHRISLGWGEGPRAQSLEQSIYVAL